MSEPIDLEGITEPFNAEKFLGLDRRTVVGDSVATTEGNSWEEAADERVWRYSYKWKIIPESTKPLLDYVFAADIDEARAKAYERLEIPEGEPMEILRVSETTNKTWSLS